jgi:hypothetical protein
MARGLIILGAVWSAIGLERGWPEGGAIPYWFYLYVGIAALLIGLFLEWRAESRKR